MDFNAIIEPAIKFFSTGIGAMIAEFARAIYNALYPANAGAATTETSAVTPPPGKSGRTRTFGRRKAGAKFTARSGSNQYHNW